MKKVIVSCLKMNQQEKLFAKQFKKLKIVFDTKRQLDW